MREAPAGLRAAQPGTILKATVLGRDDAGHLSLRTARGVLVLATRANPPVGSQVTLQLRPAGAQMQAYILNIRPPSGAAGSSATATPTPTTRESPHPAGVLPDRSSGPLPALLQSVPALSREWPTLTIALLALQRPGVGSRIAESAAGQISAGNPLVQAIPRPGPALAPGLLFLMAALKGGDISRWLGGEPLRALERAGHGDLIRQLKGDFEHLSRLARDTGDNWRLFALPVLADGAIRPLRLFLRRTPADDSDAAENMPPIRFVVELDLSGLGELQLDGFAYRKQMQLILRSRLPLPDATRSDLRGAFTRALDSFGGQGSLNFHAGDDWRFLPVPSEMPAGSVSV